MPLPLLSKRLRAAKVVKNSGVYEVVTPRATALVSRKRVQLYDAAKNASDSLNLGATHSYIIITYSLKLGYTQYKC